MKRRGFTVTELIIVVTIMGILLILGVVNLRGSQANGRDAERKADIEAIALHLETYYTNGNTGSNVLGYPPTIFTATPTTYLEDIDTDSITAPDSGNTSASTFIPATNNSTTVSTIAPQPTIDQYVYQPLQSDGSLCTTALQECRKFYIYYRLEADQTVYQFSSRNQ